MSEPKRCPNPNCKSDRLTVSVRGGGDDERRYVVCLNCGMTGPTGYSREGAVTFWNNLLRSPDIEEIVELTRDVLLHVGESDYAFRCNCGSNVFLKISVNREIKYRCHGCGADYRGE